MGMNGWMEEEGRLSMFFVERNRPMGAPLPSGAIALIEDNGKGKRVVPFGKSKELGNEFS